MSKEDFVMVNNIIDYIDPKTGISMNMKIMLPVSISLDKCSYEKTLLLINIYEPRVNNSLKVSLYINHTFSLMRQLNSFFKSGPIDAFKLGGCVRILRYSKKSRSELLFNFSYDYEENTPYISMTIINTLSAINKLTIPLSYDIFICISELLKEYTTNFLRIDSGLKSSLAIHKFSNIITTKISNISENLNAGINKISRHINDVMISEDSTNEDYDEYLDLNVSDECKSDGNIAVDMQNIFDNRCKQTKMFENIRLPEISDIQTSNHMTISSKLFMTNFLQCRIDRLDEWIAAFISTTSNSSELMFAPIDIIMNQCGIKKDDISDIVNTYGYYRMQYGMMEIIKIGIRDYIMKQNSDKFLMKKIPPIKFSKVIDKQHCLYDMTKEMITIYLLYNMIVNRYFKWIENNSVEKKTIYECNRNLFVLKILFTPFILSLKMEDDFIDEMTIEYERCKECGLFNSMEKKYGELTLGGKLIMTLEIFLENFKPFYKKLKNTKTFNFDTYEEVNIIFKQFDIPIPNIDIVSDLDIRKAIFPENKKEILTKKNDIKKNIIERDIVHMDIRDPILDIFLNAGSQYINAELLNNINNNCKSFDDLSKFMLKCDIPDELFKIKRVLEIDNSLKDKSSILKLAKLLKEDDDITKTRIMNDNIVETSINDIDLVDIINHEDI